MSDSPEEHPAPDWALLPRDPVRFFALNDGFDRKDLKRSYNALIRRFKPEKCPEEFQRIRAAYEELERRLRYGQATDLEPETAWSWVGKDEDHSRPVGADGAGAIPAGLDPSSLAARVEAGGESLEALYRAVLEAPQKAPHDYYSLALLSDASSTDDGRGFLEWLLEGLRAFPADTGLARLVYGYLTSQVPDADVPAVLVACSEAVSHDGFYPLTEGAWDRLLRERSFATFLETLRKCEANLHSDRGDGSISGKIAFYIHALRYAMWRDPTDWKNDALDFVEENFDQAPSHLENDLDLLGVVREYLQVRDRFVASHEHCRRIDAVLESIFTGDPMTADRELVDCQLAMLDDPEGVQRAFPPAEHEVHLIAYPLWAWVANDAAARMADERTGEVDYNFWRGQIRSLLLNLNNRLGNSATGAFWSIATVAYGLVKYSAFFLALCLLFFVVMALSSEVLGDISDDAIVVVFLVILLGITLPVGVYCYYKLLPWIDERVWNPFCRRMARRSYRKLWRSEVRGFLDRSLLDYFELRALINEASDQLDSWAWINSLVHQDGALAMYSLAQRFKS